MNKLLKYIVQRANAKPKNGSGPNLRVAICIAGQMRGYEQAFPSVKKYLIDPLGADVFVHTWNEIGSSVNEHKRLLPMPLPYYLSGKLRRDRPHFEAVFPAFTASVSKTTFVNHDDLKKLYDAKEVVVETSPNPEDYDEFFGIKVPGKLLKAQTKSQWSRQLFYKIWKCNELKKAAENAGNFKYDLVIRLRPDLLIGNSIPQEHLDDLDKLYFRIRNINPSYQMADQYFYGSSKAMDVASETFNRIPEFWQEFDNGKRHHKYYWAEGLLKTSTTRDNNVTLVPFRTELASEKSKFRLLMYGRQRLSYSEAKNALLSDIATMPKKQAKPMKTALSRSLASHVRRRSKRNSGKMSVHKFSNIIDKFETAAGIPANFARSLLHSAIGDLKKSTEFANKALSVEPRSNEILGHLAKISLEQGKLRDVVDYATQAIELPDEYERLSRPDKWELYGMLGRAQEELGNYEDAFYAYMATFSLNSDSAPAAFGTGKMLVKLQKYEQSLWYLKQAQTLDPNLVDAAYYEAHSLCKAGMMLDALSLTLKFVNDPKNIDASTAMFLGPLIVAQYYNRDFTEAEAAINTYLSIGEFHEDEIVEIIMIMVKMDRLTDAQILAKKGIAKYPTNKVLLQNLKQWST